MRSSEPIPPRAMEYAVLPPACREAGCRVEVRRDTNGIGVIHTAFAAPTTAFFGFADRARATDMWSDVLDWLADQHREA